MTNLEKLVANPPSWLLELMSHFVSRRCFGIYAVCYGKDCGFSAEISCDECPLRDEPSVKEWLVEEAAE